VILSDSVWEIVNTFYTPELIFEDGYVKLDLSIKPEFIRKQSKVNKLNRDFMDDDDDQMINSLTSYLPSAVTKNLNPDSPSEEQWGNEIRRACTMFVNLGINERELIASAEYDEPMGKVHQVLVTTQEAVRHYEGAINKFLMDDKGSTLIATFGLPPNSHEDDPIRAVLAGLEVCERLTDIGYTASIGITTGDVFSGVVGSKTRREYTVLGDTVNLSARLMSKSKSVGGGILVDWDTKMACEGAFEFYFYGQFRVKGKVMDVRAFQPYPAISPLCGSEMPQMTQNWFREAHMKQQQNYAIHRAFTSLQPFFTRNSMNKSSSTSSSKLDETSGKISPFRRSSLFNSKSKKGPPSSGLSIDTSGGGGGGEEKMEMGDVLSPRTRNSITSISTSPVQTPRKTRISTVSPTSSINNTENMISNNAIVDRRKSQKQQQGAFFDLSDESLHRRFSKLKRYERKIDIPPDADIVVAIPPDLKVNSFEGHCPCLPGLNINDFETIEDVLVTVHRIAK